MDRFLYFLFATLIIAAWLAFAIWIGWLVWNVTGFWGR